MTKFLATGCVLAAIAGLTRADEPPRPKGDDARKVDLDAIRFGAAQHDANAGVDSPSHYKDFNALTKGAEKIDGFLTLFKKDDHLYAEIKPHQFDQPMLAPIVISKGMAMAGNPLNFGDEWVIVLHRAGDKVQVIRRDVHHRAPAGSPAEKAVKQNYTDSILMAVPIEALNPGGGMSVVIDLADIFFTNFAELPFGGVDRSRTSWHKVKAYPNNLELQVEATFAGGGFGGMSFGGGDDGIADRRGNTMVIHYSLVKMPDAGYKPRTADDRVGHFLNATKDWGHGDPDTNFVRMVNRWRVEKADPSAKLSPPRRRMIWWVESTVPDEYRPYVQAGIEEWNKAFEPLGIRNAIEVRWQTDRDEFDPEDINYCTFKWITTSQTYAMSCLRSNPLTGEMIDGDVIFDAGFVKSFKKEYALLTGAGPAATAGPIAAGEVLSPIMATKMGYGLPSAPKLGAAAVDARPASWSDLQVKLRRRMAGSQNAGCQFSCGMQYEMGLAALAMADGGKTEPGANVPEEFIGQAIKMIVMHEVGHSLGLRHNFVASTMLTGDALNNTEITRKKGLVGSVMEYAPINIAPKGKTQGDYYSTTIGPYDYWAIEYAYKPISGDEEAELKKIAARAPEHDLAFATDDDMYGSNDPRVNVWDLGDPCQFAVDRMELATSLLKDLDAKAVKDGQSWAKNRDAFAILMSQFGNAAYLASGFIGGQATYRDHKGDKDGHDPIVPIPGAKQREALKLLVDRILGDKAFQFSPALLRRMGTEKWSHWGSDSMYESSDVAILQRVLGIQKIALNQCLSGSTLTNLQNQELQADPGTDPLKPSEVFRAMTDGIWSELSAPADAKGVKVSTIRRNLQREHLKKLATMVLGDKAPNFGGSYLYILLFSDGGSVPADARALARLHLKEIGEKAGKVLDNKALALDDTTRAHLEETRHKVAKVLDAGIDANEP